MREAKVNAPTDGAIAESAHVIQEGAGKIVEGAQGVLRGVVQDASALARNGMDRARQTGVRVREQVNHAGERTVEYIREEPVKSVLIAAAVGAASAGLIAWMSSRSRSQQQSKH